MPFQNGIKTFKWSNAANFEIDIFVSHTILKWAWGRHACVVFGPLIGLRCRWTIFARQKTEVAIPDYKIRHLWLIVIWSTKITEKVSLFPIMVYKVGIQGLNEKKTFSWFQRHIYYNFITNFELLKSLRDKSKFYCNKLARSFILIYIFYKSDFICSRQFKSSYIFREVCRICRIQFVPRIIYTYLRHRFYFKAL